MTFNVPITTTCAIKLQTAPRPALSQQPPENTRPFLYTLSGGHCFTVLSSRLTMGRQAVPDGRTSDGANGSALTLEAFTQAET